MGFHRQYFEAGKRQKKFGGGLSVKVCLNCGKPYQPFKTLEDDNRVSLAILKNWCSEKCYNEHVSKYA